MSQESVNESEYLAWWIASCFWLCQRENVLPCLSCSISILSTFCCTESLFLCTCFIASDDDVLKIFLKALAQDAEDQGFLKSFLLHVKMKVVYWRIITHGSQHQNGNYPGLISSDSSKTSFFSLNSLATNAEILFFLGVIYLWSVKVSQYKMYVRGNLDTWCFKLFISIFIFRRDFKSEEKKMLPQHLMVVVWKLYYSSRQKVFEGHTSWDALSGEKALK